MLKILHCHDSDLDDPRIICAAKTAIKAGYEVHFVGAKIEMTMNPEIFQSINYVNFTQESWIAKRMNPIATALYSGVAKTSKGLDKYLYPYPHRHAWIEKQLKEVIEKVKPDIIHAHNIIAAHYCLKYGIPMVLDDHEYLSLHARAHYEGNPRTKKTLWYTIASPIWYKWEQEIGTRCPILTVSDPIADYWKGVSKAVYTVPNYPLKDDIKIGQFNYAKNQDSITSVYLGADDIKKVKSMRNITGLHEIFNGNGTGKLIRIGVKNPNTKHIRSLGNVDMQLAYELMWQRAHIGLLAWKKHWFHPYCAPNKLAEYAHCGLWVIMPNDLDYMKGEFAGHCDTFEDFGEMAELIKYYNYHKTELDNRRIASLNYAKNNLIWEKHEHKILEAYRQA